MNDRLDSGAPRAAAMIDPITVELVRGAMRSIQNEMEALIERTAMSAFIREKKDFYAGLFDARGRFLAGKSRPGSSDLIDPILRQYPAESIKAGDLYWYKRLLRGARRRLAFAGSGVGGAGFPSGRIGGFCTGLGALQRYRRHACGLDLAELHRDLPGRDHRAAGASGGRRAHQRRIAAVVFA
jgi:hypothetical protein